MGIISSSLYTKYKEMGYYDEENKEKEKELKMNSVYYIYDKETDRISKPYISKSDFQMRYKYEEALEETAQKVNVSIEELKKRYFLIALDNQLFRLVIGDKQKNDSLQ